MTVFRAQRDPDTHKEPEATKWSKVENICPIAKLDGQNRLFFRHWEIKLTFPVIVITSVTVTFLVFITAVHPCLESHTLKVVSLTCVVSSLVLFLWSYFAAVLMDPGFLPFNWYQTQRMKYHWTEQLSGLAVTHEQVEYALTHPRPTLCSFSRSFGRFILRGDHVCNWIANWVGKRNHKQFMLLQFYACIYTLALSISRFVVSQPLEQCSPTLGFFADMCAFLEIMISMFLLASAISSCIQLASNRTTIESWKNIQDTEGRTFREEVCGSSPVVCWLCPIPAFSDDLPFSGIDIMPVETV